MNDHPSAGDAVRGPTGAPRQPTGDPGTQPVVLVDHVHKYFGDKHALKDVSLVVEASQVVAVIGPSGSGKSTLCRCINRLERIDRGKIEIDGVPLPEEGKALAKMRSDVGMVFQSFNLFSHKTVLQNITLGPMRVRRTPKMEAEERAMTLLERVGIKDQARKFPAELSGGQQQRAAIARALAMDPKVMLFDEPTSALDPEVIREVLDVMEGLAAGGTTMLVVTHEMGFARSVAHRVLFMDEGEVVEVAEPRQFFSEPATARARDFLSKVISHRS